jgi:nucleotide-binding universal stress UspA family protein
MAKRILVPLDGSPAAESFLDVVADMARGAGAAVRLLRVEPIPDALVGTDGRIVVYADQETERLEAEALDYLGTIEKRLAGIEVESIVRFGEPLDEILREAEAFDADLIAVSTVGRSGIGRAFLGSVAEQVVRKAAAPVLLFRSSRASH